MVYKIKGATVDFTVQGEQASVVVSSLTNEQREAVARVLGGEVPEASVAASGSIAAITCPMRPRFKIVPALERALGAKARPVYASAGLKKYMEQAAGEVAENGELPRNPAERTMPVLLSDVDAAPAVIELDDVTCDDGHRLSDYQARLVWKRGDEATYILEAL